MRLIGLAAGAALVGIAVRVAPLSGQASDSAAHAPRAFDLSVDNIMRGPDLFGTAPSRVTFSDDSRWVYFRWKKPGVDTAEAAYRIAVPGGEPERLDSLAADTLYPAPGEWSLDRRLKVYAHRGTVYLWDAARGTRRPVIQTPGGLAGLQLSRDGHAIFFVRDDNVFSLSLDGGQLRQLTDVRRGPPTRTPTDTSAQRRFLRDQQRELFDVIRHPPAGSERGRPRPDSLLVPRPFYLADNQSLAETSVSPDGAYLLFTLYERAAGELVQPLPLWVTASGYVETRPNRGKVGDAQSIEKTGVMDLSTGVVTWIAPDLGGRKADISGIGWSSNGRHALVRGVAADFHDRWLWVLDAPDFKARMLDDVRDSAWVGGFSYDAGWLPDGETAYFTSEASGWAHLYTVSASGGSPRALTSGPWEVENAELSPDGRRFYLQTSEVHWGERQIYGMNTDGSGKVRLTEAVGRHEAVVSPDERWLATLFSTANHPPELYLQPNRAGAARRQITESTTEEFRRYPWRVPDLVMIPASDGVEVPGRLYRPAHPNGAAVIFVHGAGYLQNVHKWWSDYPREYLFHHLLAERGFVVLDLDYRGSAGHGRDWRTAIYKHMGGRDLDDQVDGARWLVRTQGVDSARIGIYGGSYGGFITLMAMFTRPGVFRAGAALRPVSDWAHYWHGYTAEILGQPQDDSAAYRRSSPIYFADGLRGQLLICHGLVDDNVNFEDTARLIERLIELRKDHWWVAIYPAESHGFRTAASWTDEYKRILDLFETSLAIR